jgi:hypothetical protein
MLRRVYKKKRRHQKSVEEEPVSHIPRETLRKPTSANKFRKTPTSLEQIEAKGIRTTRFMQRCGEGVEKIIQSEDEYRAKRAKSLDYKKQTFKMPEEV